MQTDKQSAWPTAAVGTAVYQQNNPSNVHTGGVVHVQKGNKRKNERSLCHADWQTMSVDPQFFCRAHSSRMCVDYVCMHVK